MQGALLAAIVTVGSIVLLGLALFYVRLRTLGRRVGSFECALRTPTGWASGVAHFGADRLSWYRTISLSPRAAREWERSALEIVNRAVRAQDEPGDPSDVVEATCRASSDEFVLAMRAGSYSGFASWLESLPPRERVS